MDILIRQGTVRFPKMMAMAVVVSLALAVLMYAPAGWSLTRVAAPIEYPYDAPPFRRSDIVLINRWAYAMTPPRRGDVVRFSSCEHCTGWVDAGRSLNTRYVYEEDELIDRVLGLPGDRVVWDEAKLSINGTPVSWKPLRPRAVAEPPRDCRPRRPLPDPADDLVSTGRRPSPGRTSA